MAIMRSMPQGSDLSIARLMASHSDLCGQLAEINLFSALRLIGGLETVPELQKNSVRLSVLLHLAHVCCKGEREANPSDMVSWLKHLDKSPTKLQEDPSEDIFIGYICSPEGGFRVFPGIISHADFILERLLRFLAEKRSFPTFGEAIDSLIELLKMSEAIADKLRFPRYLPGDEGVSGELVFPRERNAKTHAEAVTFSQSRLEELQINSEKLSPFIIHSSTLEKLRSESLQGSSVERFPLFEKNGTIVVSSPALLCRAGAKFVLEMAATMGGCADTFFEKESAEYFINEIILSLGIKQINGIELPTPSQKLSLLYPFTGQFDYGMPVLALTYTSPLTSGSDLEKFEKIEDEQVSEFTEYLLACCKALEKIEGFKGGMILFAVSGVGRTIVFPLHKLSPAWRFYSSSLADWRTLASSNKFDARRLWYLSLQEKMAEDAGVRFMNTAGLINLYGLWKKQGFTLIPADIDLKKSDKMLGLYGGFSKTVNTELKNLYDRHCRWHPIESCSFDMQRMGEGLNPDISRNLKYGDHESARKGILRACIVREPDAWWIEIPDRLTDRGAFDLGYRLWDCVMNWCERLMLHMTDKHPNCIPNELVIQLNLPNVDEWDLNAISQSTAKFDALRCQQGEAKGLIFLTIEESFLINFFQAKNVAERAIVTALVNVFFVEATSQEHKSIVLEVLKNEDTKFFHTLKARNLEDVLANGYANPLLAPDEELWRASIGLAYKVSDSPPEKIHDTKEAVRFIETVVAKLQESISAKLKGLAILPVVSQAFSQLDELFRDRARLGLSVRALLALEDNADWLVKYIRIKKGKLVHAEVTNRILIETACYSCVSTGQVFPSKTEILTILAEISVMIRLAGYRDAIANGLVETNLKIHPNGQIEFNDSFHEEVMQPYITSLVDDEICYNAESYDDNFDEPSLGNIQDAESKKTREKLESAFIAEYGFGLDLLKKVVEVFSECSIKTGKACETIDEVLLGRIFKYVIGFTDEQIERFLEKFVLSIRSCGTRNYLKGVRLMMCFPGAFFVVYQCFFDPLLRFQNLLAALRSQLLISIGGRLTLFDQSVTVNFQTAFSNRRN